MNLGNNGIFRRTNNNIINLEQNIGLRDINEQEGNVIRMHPQINNSRENIRKQSENPQQIGDDEIN